MAFENFLNMTFTFQRLLTVFYFEKMPQNIDLKGLCIFVCSDV